jgi:ferrous iron transport protein B
MWDRSKLFLRRAGTIILGINILLWGLATYPRGSAFEQRYAARRAELKQQVAAATARGAKDRVSSITAKLTELENEEAGLRLRNSFAGRLGRLIEPVIAPLGFDWKMGIGIIASFAAREVFVSTMATVYGVEKYDRSESSLSNLAKTLQAQRQVDGGATYTTLTGITLMVFYVFALQCASTVAVVRRETNSWKWPLFQWFYMGSLAWFLAFVINQGGRALGWD